MTRTNAETPSGLGQALRSAHVSELKPLRTPDRHTDSAVMAAGASPVGEALPHRGGRPSLCLPTHPCAKKRRPNGWARSCSHGTLSFRPVDVSFEDTRGCAPVRCSARPATPPPCRHTRAQATCAGSGNSGPTGCIKLETKNIPGVSAGGPHVLKLANVTTNPCLVWPHYILYVMKLCTKKN